MIKNNAIKEAKKKNDEVVKNTLLNGVNSPGVSSGLELILKANENLKTYV